MYYCYLCIVVISDSEQHVTSTSFSEAFKLKVSEAGEKARQESSLFPCVQLLIVSGCWLTPRSQRSRSIFTLFTIVRLNGEKIAGRRRHRLPLLDRRGQFGLCDSGR